MKYGKLMWAPLGIVLAGILVLICKKHVMGVQGAAELMQGVDWSFLPWLAAVAILSVFLQYLLVRRRADPLLLPIALTLASVGAVEIGRLKAALFMPQLRWLCIALVVMILVLRFWRSLQQLLDYPYLLGLACVVVLGLPMLFGTEIGGSKNWLVLGPMSVQPSEFGKIIILFFLAAYLSDHQQVLTAAKSRLLVLRLAPLRFIAPLICIWGLAVLMFVVEKDLGSALLFFGIAVLMTYMATGNKSYVFLALSFFGIAAIISYMLFGHVRVRVAIWLNPWSDPNGMAYQVVQSLFAFGTGGVWGTGFGFGHPGFIPEVHTDFIYAAIAEEWGLVGALMVLLCYVLFFWRGVRIALGCRDSRAALLAAGCASLMLLQAFIIVAGVTKFLPLTGITLPFVSYGGSSLVSCFILLGILAALSERRRSRA